MDKFSEFLNQRKEKKQEASIDKELVIKQFQDSVEQFHQNVEIWLKPYLENNIGYEYLNVPITEELLGTYDVKKMTIRFYDATVVLEPVGAIIIAAAGRIDMIGPHGKASMLLVSPEGPRVTTTISTATNPAVPEAPKETPYENLIWKFMVRTPQLHYLPVNEDSFKDFLMRVIGE